MPKLTRLTVFGELSREVAVRHTQDAARGLGVTVALVEFTRPDALDAALRAVSHTHPEGLYVLNTALTATHRARITDFALKNHVPLVSSTGEWAVAGALMTYAPSLIDSSRRAAAYVDKILKGARPADLPIEQPMAALRQAPVPLCQRAPAWPLLVPALARPQRDTNSSVTRENRGIVRVRDRGARRPRGNR